MTDFLQRRFQKRQYTVGAAQVAIVAPISGTLCTIRNAGATRVRFTTDQSNPAAYDTIEADLTELIGNYGLIFDVGDTIGWISCDEAGQADVRVTFLHAWQE